MYIIKRLIFKTQLSSSCCAKTSLRELFHSITPKNIFSEVAGKFCIACHLHKGYHNAIFLFNVQNDVFDSILLIRSPSMNLMANRPNDIVIANFI